MIYETITGCRLCGSGGLTCVLDLGTSPLSGTFPLPGEAVAFGPLRLLECQGCGMVQLGENYDPELLYHRGYGYRSGLNSSMAEHLKGVAEYCERIAQPGPDELIIDIGSNDGTLLSHYTKGNGSIKIGVDPIASNFQYDMGTIVFSEFFTAETITKFTKAKAKIITSIACFYDLQNVGDFVESITKVLGPDGIWVSEQSYLPAMVKANSFDTICHEHLEYYTLQQFDFIAEWFGLKIIDVQFNDINGGSFMVTMCHKDSDYVGSPGLTSDVLKEEAEFHKIKCLEQFASEIPHLRSRIIQQLTKLKADGKSVLGYGASTKGNILLNYCGITTDLLPAIAEVNESKFGCVTPGTNIPITSEADARAREPDCFFVLPWHFREMIIKKELDFLGSGGKLIFPLPNYEVVG